MAPPCVSDSRRRALLAEHEDLLRGVARRFVIDQELARASVNTSTR
jgi:hypothetical protein